MTTLPVFFRLLCDFFRNPKHQHGSIHICIVACGDRLEESLVLLKSAVLFAKSPLVFHIFAEDHLQQSFKDQVCNVSCRFLIEPRHEKTCLRGL